MSACTPPFNNNATQPIPDTWGEQYALAQSLAAQEGDNPTANAAIVRVPTQGFTYHPKMTTSFHFVSTDGDFILVFLDNDTAMSRVTSSAKMLPPASREDAIWADAAHNVQLTPRAVISQTLDIALPFLREHGATMDINMILLAGADLPDTIAVSTAWNIDYRAEDGSTLHLIVNAQTGVIFSSRTTLRE